MSDPDDSLPQRMREAADTLTAVNACLAFEPGASWVPRELRRTADIIEARPDSDSERLIEELAIDLFHANELDGPWLSLPAWRQSIYRGPVRYLIAKGWTKGGAS
jgi:hypothetical protein